jgi:alcohol dehydrogenase class IV
MLVDDTVAAARLSFDTPTLEFGDGARAALPDLLAEHNVESPLVVTDEGVEDAGIATDVLGPLTGEPTRYRAITEPGTDDFDGLPDGEFDGLVAVGGGSVLDTAKVAALLLTHGGDPADYLGEGQVPGPVLPLVAVPTTSGTGSQATQTAVLAHDGVKRGASDESLRPNVAVVDPELTVDLPRSVTARSGFDAFVHALESLTARDYRWVPDRPINYQGAHPVSRALAGRALRLVWTGLERAVHDGADREARRQLSLGSHLAGAAFSNSGLGIVHAFASTVGGMTGAPHGDCLAASIRAGLAYNHPVRREQYAAVARWLDLAGADDTDEEAAAALVAECIRLRDAIGLPDSFAALGLDADDVDAIVENTLVQERRLHTNPREAVADDLETVLAAALD